MPPQDIDDIAYFPNGEINASFILSNANLLLKEGEVDLSLSLFRLMKSHQKFGYCGHYGIGQCLQRMNHPEQAVIAFEKAFSLSRRPFIAVALIEALVQCREFDAAANRAIEYGSEFSNDAYFLSLFRKQHERCITK